MAHHPVDALPRCGQPDHAALAAAHAAITAGCRFLIARGQHAREGARPHPSPPALRWRTAGNSLNELHRFLAILLDACLRIDHADDASGAFPASGAGTLRKLARVTLPGTGFLPDMPRLRAIGRLRAAREYRPIAFGSRMHRDLAIASAGAAHVATRGTSEISAQALAAIAEFYLSIANRLWLEVAGAAPAAQILLGGDEPVFQKSMPGDLSPAHAP